MVKKVDILGVKIDPISINESVQTISKWIKEHKKSYVVTPNIEFIVAAQKDKSFREVLNKADLAIPDSARLGWAYTMLEQKSLISRLFYFPFSLLPTAFAGFKRIPVTTGTDLMATLLDESGDKGFVIGFLGGKNKVADRLRDCLLARNPKLKIAYADSTAVINSEGQVISPNGSTHNSLKVPKLDILFVAFGQGKQEKWMKDNLQKQPVTVMMGVGGAFDYLVGDVDRAPVWIRKIGFEWLYRLINQPWRFKRQLKLLVFLKDILLAPRTS